MPTYDYECSLCGKRVEFEQSFRDKPKKKCPECGKQTLNKLISGGVGVMFKGSGFYVNDSKPQKPTKQANTETKSAPKKPNKTVTEQAS